MTSDVSHWKSAAGEPFLAVTLPGGHFEILAPPNCEVIARQIAALIGIDRQDAFAASYAERDPAGAEVGVKDRPLLGLKKFQPPAQIRPHQGARRNTRRI